MKIAIRENRVLSMKGARQLFGNEPGSFREWARVNLAHVSENQLSPKLRQIVFGGAKPKGPPKKSK